VAWSGLTSALHAPQAHLGTYLGLLIGWNWLVRPETTWFEMQLAVLLLVGGSSVASADNV